MTTETTQGIISKRSETVYKPSRYAQRSMIFRLYMRAKLLRVTSGCIKVKGLYVRKPGSTDLPAFETVIVPPSWYYDMPTDDRLATVSTTRHGAWLGTAVLLISDTIPRAVS